MADAATEGRIHAVIEGDVHGQVAIGENIVQIGSMHGGIVVAGDRSVRPRRLASPVLIRPRRAEGTIGRGTELTALRERLAGRASVWLHGEPGIGKTTLLRELAHDSVSDAAPDGVVYLRVAGRPADDVLQLVYDAFHESEIPTRLREGELRRELQSIRARILLDDVEADRAEHERILDAAPECPVVVASGSAAPAGVDGTALEGLDADEAGELLARELGRPLEPSEAQMARILSIQLAGHPLRLLRAAGLIREGDSSVSELAEAVAAGASIEVLERAALQPIADQERRVLSVLASLRGAPLGEAHVEAVAGVVGAGATLAELKRRGLVEEAEEGWSTPLPVDRLVADPGERDALQLRLVRHLATAAQRAVDLPTDERREAAQSEVEAMLRGSELAEERRDWPTVMALAALLGLALPARAEWGRWGQLLERAGRAAEALGDRAAEAWVLHERGTRMEALEGGEGVSMLRRALEIRTELGDADAVAVTRHNLDWATGVTSGEGESDSGDAEEGGGDSDLGNGGGGGGFGGGGLPGWVVPTGAGVAVVAVGAWVALAGPSLWSSGDDASEPAIVSPLALDFEQQELGGASPTRAISITRAGAGGIDSVRARLVGLGAGEFALDRTLCTSAPSEECAFQLTFAPAGTGPRLAQLVLRTWPGGGTTEVPLAGEGVAPARPVTRDIALLLDSLQLGAATVFTRRDGEQVMIRNVGDVPIELGDVSVAGIPGEGAEAFGWEAEATASGTTCVDAPLTAGGECRIGISFTPRRSGEHRGRLTIRSADGSTPERSVALSGVGLDAPPPLRTSPGRVDFETVSPGETVRRSVDLYWAGAVAPDSVTTTVVSGVDFAVSPSSCSGASAVAGDCTLLVAYGPGAAGTSTGVLGLRAWPHTELRVVPLIGAAEDRFDLAIGSRRVDFGGVPVGRSELRSIALRNPGTGPLRGLRTEVVGSEVFAVTAPCPSTLAAGDSCDLGVTLAPGARESVSGAVEVREGSGAVLGRIALSGRGIGAEFELDSTTLEFVQGAVGQMQSARVRIRNVGEMAGRLGRVRLTEDGTPFGVRLGGAPSIAAVAPAGARWCMEGNTLRQGEGCDVLVTYDPVEGSHAAWVEVTHSGPSSPDSVRLVAKTAANPLVVARPELRDFLARRTSPNLVVSAVTPGRPTLEGNTFVVPVSVTIANGGAATTNRFKLAARDDAGRFLPLGPAAGEPASYVWADGLAAGASRTIRALVRVTARASVTFVIEVDSCAGDEFVPENCRVAEGDENDNLSSPTTVRLVIGELLHPTPWTSP